MALQLLCTVTLAFIFGLLLLFAGYRFFLFLLPFWGFFAGFALGAGVVTNIFGDGFLATTTSWVVGFVIAVIFALLAYLFYAIALAIFAGSFGYALGAAFLGLFGITTPWLVVPIGIVVAVVAVAVMFLFNLQKWIIIAFTAMAGAGAVIGSIMLMFGQIPMDSFNRATIAGSIQNSWLWVLVWAVLAIIGAFLQIRSTSRYVYVAPEPMGRTVVISQ